MLFGIGVQTFAVRPIDIPHFVWNLAVSEGRIDILSMPTPSVPVWEADAGTITIISGGQ